ncbi:bifunctional diaminohydroxyphosphoribosylaminopyrimidine deaminase/5-amino-6-(5-phosphoribosylamino)uracil reductase RibD [Devosia lacusdianchii]|uniref:bifunctional diaminohydroxyphosphoribosylaminopyrimidine deaminase/5-amino-6-(5-phosphoribosylamino)uracil reductase RibD n=1 Tax=Devosia lacusdianchii TaxID=2917991 RepID=UPI001F069DED|nr:bifunctional diaminohydroxyphosphoribosylaminopyrimidine deaminase/5-amino-6-(5-phosphoribosylamino)uracil reductase RibD [Devosia sp. JXJ CY 41]
MTTATSEDLRWLDAAARYAMPFLGTTADNPTVAALLVNASNQSLIARAVTAKGGRPHAEAQVLGAAGFDAAGNTLYLTLEPCHHWSRTPPCVDAIVRSGVMRVVIGAADGDPRHAGESIKRLESAGVEVVLANHAPSIALHAGHSTRASLGRPLVTACLIVSADGMIGRRDGGRADLGTAAAHNWLDTMRARSDAILIGSGTARSDDPHLTIRLPGLQSRTPLRVVLAGRTGIDRQVNLIGGFSGYRTAIIAETGSTIDAPASVETIRIAGAKDRPDLGKALTALGDRGMQNVLVEPGPRLTAALLEADLVDRFALITSPVTIGDTGIAASPDGAIERVLDAVGLVPGDQQALGEDVLTLYRRPA